MTRPTEAGDDFIGPYIHCTANYVCFVALKAQHSYRPHVHLSVCPFVCLSVCPSHAGSASKRITVGSCGFHSRA